MSFCPSILIQYSDIIYNWNCISYRLDQPELYKTQYSYTSHIIVLNTTKVKKHIIVLNTTIVKKHEIVLYTILIAISAIVLYTTSMTINTDCEPWNHFKVMMIINVCQTWNYGIFQTIFVDCYIIVINITVLYTLFLIIDYLH